MKESTWVLKVNDAGVQITRLHEGKTIEVYRAVSHAEGAIWAAAISQGFQPPRDLRECGNHDLDTHSVENPHPEGN